jgi:hypothetical protein
LSHSGPVSSRNPLFSTLKANGMMMPGATAPRSTRPQRRERANRSWSSTASARSSTVRHAGDLDYRLVVVRDCCADPDAEVHAMLLDIVIAKQAAVVATAELAGALPGRSS